MKTVLRAFRQVSGATGVLLLLLLGAILALAPAASASVAVTQGTDHSTQAQTYDPSVPVDRASREPTPCAGSFVGLLAAPSARSASDPDGNRPLGATDTGCSNCRKTYTKGANGKTRSSWKYGNENLRQDPYTRRISPDTGASRSYIKSVFGARHRGSRYGATAGPGPSSKTSEVIAQVAGAALSLGVTGPVVDLLSAGYEWRRGNYDEARWSMVGAIPIGGDIAQVGRASRRVGNIAESGAAKSETSLVRYKEWPDNDGFFAGFEKDTVLQPGTRIDRYGSNRGSFVSPEGTPFKNRGLPSSRAGDPYSSFTVKKPITVRGGIAAPWMDSPGGGVQYLLPRSVQDLLGGGFLG